MTTDIRYWLQGESIQNFGDYLTEYFLHHLFFPQSAEGRQLRIVGSCIDDWFVEPPAPEGAPPRSGPIFWGCGLRREDGLSPDRQSQAEFLSVRGPLTRAALRLGNSVPIGDPALLLPALHRPGSLWRDNDAALLVPHFHDQRSDTELLALSGCTAVLRPNIAATLTAAGEFIDQIIAAKFVLCGSLHAAIAAAAYGRPFAFWESGAVDLPFKWRDFAAALQIPCEFQPHLAAGQAHYAAEIAPALRLPVLWPLLVAAPLPVRPDAFVRIVEMDVARHGMAAFAAGASAHAADRLHDRLREIAGHTEALGALREEIDSLNDTQRQSKEHLAELLSAQALLATEHAVTLAQGAAARETFAAALAHQTETLTRQEAQLAETAARDLRMQSELQEHRARNARLARLEQELQQTRARAAQLAAEEARLHVAVQDRDHALAVTRHDAAQDAATLDAIRRSRTWRALAPARAAARRMGWAGRAYRRARRAARMLVTLQVGTYWQRRSAIKRETALLAGSALFDPAYYRTQVPELAAGGADPIAHYLTTGASRGADPNPMFDSRWYAATYLSGTPARLSPLGHYLTQGAAVGYDPHPLFETHWYCEQHPGVTPAGALLHYLRAPDSGPPNRLFDMPGYRSEYPDAHNCDPVQHFIHHGAARGHQPHPMFDTAWYLATYPDAAASGLNPLAHYLRVGAAKHYETSPLQSRIAGFDINQTLAFPTLEQPEASIVIPAYGHYFDTLRCLHSIAAHTGDWVGYEVIILDDNPANPLAPLLAGIAGLRIISNAKNLGFLRSCNQARMFARGAHIVFLNNDTLVATDWLDPMLKLVRRDPKIGMVGCKLLNADGTVQEAGGSMFRNGWGYAFGRGDDANRPQYNYLREVDVVIGAAFLVRRDLFTAIGGFDDRYAPAFYEEFDLAFAIRKAGYKVMYQPLSVVTHLGSSSYGAETRDKQSMLNHEKFLLKWHAELAAQPEGDGDLFLARQRPGQIGTILMIDDKVPEYDRHAGALTIFQYLKLLGNLGFRIVYCPADLTIRQPYTAVLQDLGIEVLHAPYSLAGWLDENGRYVTAVWTARPDVSAGLIDLLRASTTAQILYYPHDLHYLRELRRYRLDGDLWALGESNRVRKLEHAIFRQVDCVMTPSPVEAEIIIKDVPSAMVRVIPPYLYPTQNAGGLDEAAFAARQNIIFIGGFKHPPNVDAAVWLVQAIMPLVWQELPGAKLLLIGDDPAPEVIALASPLVEVTGYVPELAPYFAQARLSVSPLRFGAGVKGKIVSSLQAGVPVVTTAVGNEGIALADGTQVLLGETPGELAAAIIRLALDPALCAQLSSAGAAVIRERFSEDVARACMLRILDVDLCAVCGKQSHGVRNYPHRQTGNWSEHFACETCFALNRSEALADVIVAPWRGQGVNSLAQAVPYLASLRIHEFSLGGAIGEQLQNCRLFTQSEYFDDIASGDLAPGGKLCQDLQNLAFRDAEFDLLISQDVFEHVPDAKRGFAETHRVLKPGGRHIFTVPYRPDLATTLVRAEMTAAGIHHLLPPVYHGDPLRPEGALAYREFGRDLIEMLEDAGFNVVLHERRADVAGGYVAVFCATKEAVLF